MEGDKEEILCIRFNQDQTYFAVGTQRGFKVFKMGMEIELAISRQFGSGIGLVEMIHKTNIFGIVGGGKTPRYPKNKFMLWDDIQLRPSVETSCKSQVKAVKLTTQRCILVLQTKLYVFNLSDFRVLDTVETCPNPRGLCTVSSLRDEAMILAFPSKKPGTVEIAYPDQSKHKIQAHKSILYALELCPNGLKLATASQKGTLIRIFDVSTRQCIQQLRRGSEQATIYSVAFDLTSRYLSCSSDSGTVHIFALKQLKEEEQTLNRRSKFAILSKISSYFDSQWSFASYHTSQKKTKVGFLAKQNKVVIVSTSGLVHIVQFPTEKQQSNSCTKIAEYHLFELDHKP